MTTNFDLKETFSKQHILHNFGLKILSLIIAIALWMIVVNVNDPIMNKEIKNVPVKLINVNAMEEMGKTVEIVEESDIIPYVTIKAPRSVLQNLGTSPENIVATADMSSLLADSENVPINLSVVKFSDKIESVKPSQQYVKVKIENKKTIQLPLYATTSGDIESGYVLGNVKLGQNQVRISGPESVISKIKNASVDVQITGFTGNISTQADIVLYDENRNTVSTKNLKLNVSSVNVDVEILATKKVPIYYATIGTAAEGYEATGIVKCEPETVVIAGTKDDIDNISYVNIPASELNITGQTSDMYVVLNLESFLPEKVRLADAGNSGKVSFTVYIEPYAEEVYTVNTKNISILNIPEGFEAEFVPEKDEYKFVLLGLSQKLEKLVPSTFNYRVDFDDYVLLADGEPVIEEGTYELSLVMDLPTGVTVKEPIGVEINLISKKVKHK